MEQFQRSDGKFYPAAVQHVWARSTRGFPASGPGSRSSMANEGSVTIDLSNLSFAGASPRSRQTRRRHADRRRAGRPIDAISEADAEGYGDDSGELSDAELDG